MLLKWLDENQAIDNRIIPPYVTGTLKKFNECDLNIQKIWCLTQKFESSLQQR